VLQHIGIDRIEIIKPSGRGGCPPRNSTGELSPVDELRSVGNRAAWAAGENWQCDVINPRLALVPPGLGVVQSEKPHGNRHARPTISPRLHGTGTDCETRT